MCEWSHCTVLQHKAIILNICFGKVSNAWPLHEHLHLRNNQPSRFPLGGTGRTLQRSASCHGAAYSEPRKTDVTLFPDKNLITIQAIWRENAEDTKLPFWRWKVPWQRHGEKSLVRQCTFLGPYIICYHIKLAKNIHKNGTKVARLHLCLSSFVWL